MSNNNNNNQKEQQGVKAVAEALRSGGTLLQASCPVCSYPLIKIKDKIYCKVCNNEVIIYKDETDLPKKYQKLLRKQQSPEAEPIYESSMHRTLSIKIESLRKKLEAAEDPDEIIKLTEAIDKLITTLEKIDVD